VDRVHGCGPCKGGGPRWTGARELAAGWGKRRRASGVLTEGFGGRFDDEAKQAAVKGEQRR
jgi:hypothetical protein